MRKGISGVLLALVGFSLSFGPAAAADMGAPVYRKAPPPVAVYNWTGCYIGVEGGGQWGNGRSLSLGLNNGVPTRIPAGTLHNDTDLRGGLIGGTVGCNYEVDRWVFGIEGDGSWSDASGTAPTPPPFNPNFNEDLNVHWLATVRGRIGYAVRDNVLLYGTAGGAFADLRVREYDTRDATAFAVETHTFSGWTAGVGLEWGFAPAWSAKFEYLYIDLGRQNYFQTTATGCCTYQSTRLIDNVVRAGINYRFNWGGPVVAKY
jgi:outer membrane immunogenic protein